MQTTLKNVELHDDALSSQETGPGRQQRAAAVNGDARVAVCESVVRVPSWPRCPLRLRLQQQSRYTEKQLRLNDTVEVPANLSFAALVLASL